MINFIPYILIAAAMTSASATAAATLDGLDNIRDGVRYDVTAERVFVGSVEGRPQVRDDYVYFSLLTGNSRVDVEIGPREFFTRSGLKLRAGKMVTVSGMPATIRDKEIVLAREVTASGSMLVVRDHEGRPMWERGGPVLLDPERRGEPFRVCVPFSPR